MSLAERLVREALDENIVLYLEGGKLAYLLEGDKIPAELRARIIELKDEIIAFLSESPEEVIAPADRTLPLPLSFAQQRLWFVDQLEGGSRQYNVLNVLKLSGALNKAALTRVFDTLLERHEILRTTYSGKGEFPHQVVNGVLPMEIAHVNLSELGQAERHQRVQDFVRQEANYVFDLSRDLMLRVVLIQTRQDEHVLIISMHHIVSDGWSMAVLTREFCALYQAYSTGADNPLPPLEIQYADFAHWQRRTLNDERLSKQLDHWIGRLQGLPALHGVPLDRPRPPRASFLGSSYGMHLPREVLDDLNALARRHDATLFMVLLSAYSLLLARWSGQTDIVLASPIAGRTQAQVEPLLGIFLNSLVYRVEVRLDETFASLLSATRTHALEAYANQDLPFEMLVDKLQPRRSLSHSPLFQIMFTLQNNERAELALPGLLIESMDSAQEIVKCDIAFEARADDDGLRLHWSYARELFDESTIAGMADSFDVLLRAIIADSSSPARELPLLPDADAQLQKTWESVAEQRDSQSLHKRLEQRFLKIGDAVAMTCGERQVTYRSLDEQAQRVARLLTRRGGVAGMTVGIYVSDPVLRVVAALAAMKCAMCALTIEPGVAVESPSEAAVRLAMGLLITDEVLRAQCLGAASIIVSIEGTGVACGTDDGAAGLAPPASDELPAFLTAGWSPDGSVRYTRHTHGQVLSQFSRWEAIHRPGEMASLLSVPGSALFAPLEWLFALLSGMRLHLLEASEGEDVELLADAIETGQIHHLTLPASLLMYLPCRAGYQLATLAVVGDWIADTTVAKWSGTCRLVCFDGPDTAPYAFHSVMESVGPIRLRRPDRSLALAVRDTAGGPLPTGAIGELMVLSPQDGDRPGGNGTPENEDGALATGLLARQFPDGGIELLGPDAQRPVVREFGASAYVIEKQLANCGTFAGLVLMLGPSQSTGGIRACAVLPPSDRNPDDELREISIGIRKQLPDYLVPDQIFVVDSLPTDMRGRIDRARVMAQAEYWATGLAPLSQASGPRAEVHQGNDSQPLLEQLPSSSDPAMAEAARRLLSVTGATLPSALLALLALAVSLHVGTEEVRIGALLDGSGGGFPVKRSRNEWVSLSVQAYDQIGLPSLLAQVAVAVERARYLSLPKASISRDGIVDTESWRAAAMPEVAFVFKTGGRTTEAIVSGSGRACLLCVFEQATDQLAWTWYYDKRSHQEKTISQLDACLRSLLIWAADDVDLTKGQMKARLLEVAKASLVKMKSRFAAKPH